MRKLVAILSLTLLGGVLLSGQTGSVNFLNALVRLDSNGALMVSGAVAGTQGPARNIANTQVKIDSNGNLLVALAAGGATLKVASGRLTAQAAASAGVTSAYTVGASDASYMVVANVNVTTATTHSFAVNVVYTDETNTARTTPLGFCLAGSFSFTGTIANANGTIAYVGLPYAIRAKAGTTIAITTTGTFTTVVYNVEAFVWQTA